MNLEIIVVSITVVTFVITLVREVLDYHYKKKRLQFEKQK